MKTIFFKSKKVKAAALALIICSGVVCAADKKSEKKPVNTTQDVVSSAFSKIDFVHQIQDTLRSGTEKDALALYDTIPQEFANDEELLVIKASLLVSMNSLADAKKICNEVLSINKDNKDASEILVYIAKRQNDSKALDSYIKGLVAEDEYNPIANVALGEKAFSAKNYKLSRTYYQKALVREPKNEDALFGLGQSDYYLGGKNPGMDEEAETVFKRLLEVNPNNSKAYSYLGKLAAANTDYKDAAEYAKKALELESDNYNYCLEYGMYQNYLGKFDSAKEIWTKAISIRPDYFLAYAYRGGLCDENGDIDQALSDYDNVIRCNPSYYYAYESIGVLAYRKGDWAKSREAFMKCYEMDNGANVSYPLMVTFCYYKEGNKIEAKKFSDKVLRKMDRDSIEYSVLRVWHDESGDSPLPQKIGAIENSNKRGKLHFYLALYYDTFGASNLAGEYYAKVISMNAPMIFEYRMAEWALKSVKEN